MIERDRGMVIAVLIGRKGSEGFPGKNLFKVLGKPMALYPMEAAIGCAEVDKVYLSTDDGMANTILINKPWSEFTPINGTEIGIQ